MHCWNISLVERNFVSLLTWTKDPDWFNNGMCSFCRNFAKLCATPGFWENVLNSLSCFLHWNCLFKLHYIWCLHDQFSGARHNFSKTSTSLVQSAELSCNCAISSISLDLALYLSSRAFQLEPKIFLLTSSPEFSSTAAESRVLGDDLQRTPGWRAFRQWLREILLRSLNSWKSILILYLQPQYYVWIVLVFEKRARNQSMKKVPAAPISSGPAFMHTVLQTRSSTRSGTTIM